jgi:hypothetical protein
VVSFGDAIAGYDARGLVQVAPEIIQRAAREMLALLTDAHLRAEVTEHNFEIARRYYSLEALHGYLQELLET